MKETVTFATNTYEKTYREILSAEYGKKLFCVNEDIFDDRIIIVNNIIDMKDFNSLLNSAKDDLKLTDVYYSEETTDEVMTELLGKNYNLNVFRRKISPKSTWIHFKNSRRLILSADGFRYSVSPMTAIAKCKTDWLVYCTEDVIMENVDFILPAIELMKKEDKYLSASMVWNGRLDEVIAESQEKPIGDFYINQGFSDQCFLVNVKRIKELAKIGLFKEKNPDTERRYPEYGGNLFERMIGAYMHNHGLYRITYSKATYWHESF